MFIIKIGISTAFIDMKPRTAGFNSYTKNLIEKFDKILCNSYSGIELFILDYTNESNSWIKSKNIHYTKLGENIPIKRVLWPPYISLKTKNELDVIHTPSVYGNFLNRLVSGNQANIVTLHDISSLSPHCKSSWRSSLYKIHYKSLYIETLKQADKIISISNFTKREAVDILGLDKNKIEVVYNGVNLRKFQSEKNQQKIMSKYEIKKPYIFFCGSGKKKNAIALIRAFEQIKDEGFRGELVIAGGLKGLKREVRYMKKSPYSSAISFLGFVPSEDLPSLFSGAQLFVFPSLFEGFGLPPLESMASGTPVITSNRTALPEVVGDAGIIIDPHDIEKLAEEMHRVLKNDTLQKKMKKKGLERARKFSWEKTAKKTLSVYKGLMVE